MAYNSDGYIMIDFTEVDFRRTNQTIEGLYKRCVDVIGTNKFILVINANGRTPLPATCSFTNNQYVIDTCIYMFAISSNDNLFIRRNDVPASDIIDDSSISVNKTWSSNKIDSELDTKADASALADYQPLLTAVSPISISEDDEISVDLSSYQPLLTAGDNITIDNNVISSPIIKTLTYTGNGAPTRDIEFPEQPQVILGLMRTTSNVTNLAILCSLLNWGVSLCGIGYIRTSTAPLNPFVTNFAYDNKTLKISNSAAQVWQSYNSNNISYTITYI